MSTTAFTGDVPGNYHRGLGPLLFEPYAEELVGRARALAPRRILETACGTGILTRRLPAALAPAGTIVATDLNEAMLNVARQELAGPIDLAPADMTALAYPDASFDLVVCQFGLMFVPDKSLAAREALRVLAPGGTWLTACWGPIERNGPAHVAHETLGALFPEAPPRFYQTPFSYSDAGVLRRLLEDAGFRDVHVEAVARTGSAPSARAAATGLVLGNPVAIEIDPARLPEAVDTVELALAARYGDGPICADLEALVATATA